FHHFYEKRYKIILKRLKHITQMERYQSAKKVNPGVQVVHMKNIVGVYKESSIWWIERFK
ncbi:hypothetical protein LCGC14_2890970, partial [marine sediment metagenome]